VFCLAPGDLPPDVERRLSEHLSATAAAILLVDRRAQDRRDSRDRRGTALDSPTALERRLAPDLEARRVAERRGDFESVEAPELPPELAPHAERLRFVRRRERTADEAELFRLRSMVDGWRERARENEQEATGLLRTLVGTVEDLRGLRALNPRWFLAVRRGDQAVAEYREKRVLG
jgi:phosphoglycolate phosphatase-like HAD superfamily hydrolase